VSSEKGYRRIASVRKERFRDCERVSMAASAMRPNMLQRKHGRREADEGMVWVGRKRDIGSEL
jgi:hypothetical protein